MCDEIIYAMDVVLRNVTSNIPTNVTNTISTNVTSITVSTNFDKKVKWIIIFCTQFY